MDELIRRRFSELAVLLESAMAECSSSITATVDVINGAYGNGCGVFVFGNGGSASDAQHIVAELNGRFLKERRPLKAQSLVSDTATMTSIGNDYGYAQIFVRQLDANGVEGDVAWGLSTSGNSPNVVNALRRAKEKGMKTIAITGLGGGECSDFADVLIAIPSSFTPHIQVVGMAIYHVICERIEADLE